MTVLDRAIRRRLPRPALARAIREEAGATQQELAEALGVDQSTVARWEKGTRQPTGRLAEMYLALLDELRAEVEQ